MKKIIATLVMGLLLAFSVIGISAQNDMKQDSMKTGMTKHKRHHHRMMKRHHHRMMKRHHRMMKRHHRKMMKKSM